MEKLCTKCLHQLGEKEKVCPICGETQKKPKKSRKFRLPIMIAGAAVLVFGLIFLINSFNSAAKTEEAFSSILSDRNIKKIQKTIVHRDGSDINTAEAQAIADLVKEIGEVKTEQLFHSIQTSRIFNTYKMTSDEMSIATKKKEYAVAIKDVELEQLLPGKYNATVHSVGEPLKTSYETTVSVTKKNSELKNPPYLRDLKIDKPGSFSTHYFDKIEIQLNDERISLRKLVESYPLHTLSPDLSEYQIVGHWPWGEVVSPILPLEAIDLTELSLVSKKQNEQLLELLKDTINKIEHNKLAETETTDTFKNNNVKVSSKKIGEINSLFANFLYVNEDNEIKGVSAYYNTDTTDGSAKFVYDAEKKTWALHEVVGDGFQSEHLETAILTDQFEENLDQLSPNQLLFLFEEEYANAIYSLPFEKYNKVAFKQLPVCFKNNHSLTEEKPQVNRVEALDDGKIKVYSTDVCLNSNSYESETILVKEQFRWVIDQIVKRELIK